MGVSRLDRGCVLWEGSVAGARAGASSSIAKSPALRTALTFIGTYFLSVFIASMVGIQLASTFKAQEEFIVVMVALILFSLITIAAFAITYAAARRAGVLGIVGVALALVTVVLVGLPTLLDVLAHRAVTFQGHAVEVELLLPAAVCLLIQWAFIRWRWRTTHRRSGA